MSVVKAVIDSGGAWMALEGRFKVGLCTAGKSNRDVQVLVTVMVDNYCPE